MYQNSTHTYLIRFKGNTNKYIALSQLGLIQAIKDVFNDERMYGIDSLKMFDYKTDKYKRMSVEQINLLFDYNTELMELLKRAKFIKK